MGLKIHIALDDPQKAWLDDLFKARPGRTTWDELKREPKRPRPREVASFLKHIRVMAEQADGLPPAPDILSARKRTQLVIEARALDVHEMRSLKPAKRYTLAVLLIFSQLQKALDDATRRKCCRRRKRADRAARDATDAMPARTTARVTRADTDPQTGDDQFAPTGLDIGRY
ncbi:hypothetical protein LMG27174_05600 [Paraburkholderia rhynchosiae]|uniref:Uncharacterized protein n=1 Tax=Paraburkholderia rhynchosiae TaxID=487049 RepID=A0A6J5C7V6_9BURK|nr:hypothetical protein LMG27174_05600 [Paraburkholderia rhynchosiae]